MWTSFIHAFFKQKVLKMVFLEQINLQTSFLRYPMSSVFQAASKNCGKLSLGDCEYSWNDLERGILQRC